MKNYRAFFRPFSFLTIKHSSGIFRNVIWVAPIGFSFIVAIVFVLAFKNVNFFGETGMLNKFTPFVQGLPGFYMAALAAIATFGARSLNRVMPGEAPTMHIYFNGGTLKNEPITKRLFLCSMFAYLTVLSFLLTVSGIFVQGTAELVKGLISRDFWVWAKFFVFFAYLLFIFQLVFITLWGVAYLGERMHISDME